MALVSFSTSAVRVTWDRVRGRPASVLAGGRRFRVRTLLARRDEVAAYPAALGPRVTYLLETDGGRVALVFDARRRTWHLERMEDLAAAA